MTSCGARPGRTRAPCRGCGAIWDGAEESDRKLLLSMAQKMATQKRIHA